MSIQKTGQNSKRSHIEQRQALEAYCAKHGLLLGQYAKTCSIPYDDYFRQYGVSPHAVWWLHQNDPDFQQRYVGRKFAEIEKQCAARLKVEGVFCPQFVHVYEKIRERYPAFSWTVHERERNIGVSHFVQFVNYPRRLNQTVPCLVDLVSSQEIFLYPSWSSSSPRRYAGV